MEEIIVNSLQLGITFCILVLWPFTTNAVNIILYCYRALLLGNPIVDCNPSICMSVCSTHHLSLIAFIERLLFIYFVHSFRHLELSFVLIIIM